MKEPIHFEVGGMGERSAWDVVFDYVVTGSYKGAVPCPHSSPTRDVAVEGRPEIVRKEWTVPRVVISETQGGYDLTAVCLDCILEGAKSC